MVANRALQAHALTQRHSAWIVGVAGHAAAEQRQAVEAQPKQATRAPGGAPAPAFGALTPDGILGLQRASGNAALARLLAPSSPGRQLQRCGGGACRCVECSDELDPVLTRRTLARTPKEKSIRKDGRCEPARTIPGVVFVPYVDEEIAVAKKAIEGSTKALAKQNITLDLELKPFLELDNLDFTDQNGNRTVNSYAQVGMMMEQLEPVRSKPGVVVLVVPISGAICQGHGQACYVPDLKEKYPWLKYTKRLIILGRFTSESELGEVLAHELGHHAGRPQPNDPTPYGHEEYDAHNYMNYGQGRDHYRNELLDRMCGISFQF
jgi:hypothetical protein